MLLVAPPFHLRALSVQQTLSETLGIPMQLEEAFWTPAPWPEVRLSRVEARPRFAGSTALVVRAERVALDSTSLFGSWSGDAAPPRIRIRGAEVDAGPLELRDGELEIEQVRGGVRVKGHATSPYGGWADASGTLATRREASPPLHVYLSQLAIPMRALVDADAADALGDIQLSGVLGMERVGNEGEQVDVDLRIKGVRRDGGSTWLDGTLSGGLVRHQGRILPLSRLRFQGRINEVAGLDHLRSVHGDFRGAIEARGDFEATRVDVDLDLTGVRLRIGRFFEKPQGDPARVHVETRLRDGVPERLASDVRLGELRMRVAHAAHLEGGGWRVRTPFVSLAALRPHVPALSRLDADVDGLARIEASWSPESGPSGVLDVRGARVRSSGVELAAEKLVVVLTRTALTFISPDLEIGDQTVALRSRLGWDEDSDRVDVAVQAIAREVDLAQLVPRLIALPGGAVAPSGGDSPDWEELAPSVVKLLRSRSRLLGRLRIDRSLLRIDELRGFGLDARDTEIRLALRNRRLRVEHRDRSTGADARVYSVDLGSWFPKLEERPSG